MSLPVISGATTLSPCIARRIGSGARLERIEALTGWEPVTLRTAGRLACHARLCRLPSP
jgi:hypothetical protein